MCGRYFFQMESDYIQVKILQAQLDAYKIEEFQQGEIFPTQRSLVLLPNKAQSYHPSVMTWGFHGYHNRLLINARSEGIQEKSTFRPFLNNRCAIVANGFYEWQKQGREKKKYYIQSRYTPLLFMAGIYNDNHAFVIITREACEEMMAIHHRMPLLMNEEQMCAYLHLKPYQELNDLQITMER